MNARLKYPHQFDRAFTLVELMVVIAITSILVTMAAPSFASLLKNQRVSAASSDLMAAILLARSEAIKRGMRVDLVPVDDDWAKGWTVFVDANNNQKVDAGDTIIHRHGAVSQGITVNGAFADNSSKYLAYNGTGRTRTNANSQVPQSGAFTLQTDEKTQRKIIINMLGRPRSCNPVADLSHC